jgi:hypothetical protein
VNEHEIRAAVAEWTEQIVAILPDAKIYLSGSASVRGLRPRDVDLVALVPDVRCAAKALCDIYPTLYEKQWNDAWAAFRIAGPPQVDLVLTKRGTKWDAHHRIAWNLLREDQGLLAEYAALKGDESQKAIFFERIVRLLRAETDA